MEQLSKHFYQTIIGQFLAFWFLIFKILDIFALEPNNDFKSFLNSRPLVVFLVSSCQKHQDTWGLRSLLSEKITNKVFGTACLWTQIDCVMYSPPLHLGECSMRPTLLQWLSPGFSYSPKPPNLWRRLMALSLRTGHVFLSGSHLFLNVWL